ncbi:MAG TPA: hypothetical protein DF383_04720, partial [Deltaproteobacteria bacterium]|nr:hypothetical protein [Deltaproteobacteria bacterium]
YAGIMLTLTGMGFIMPWPVRYNVLNCFIVYIAYLLLAYTPDFSLKDLINNSYFLLSIIFMSLVSTYFGNKSRRKELVLQKELKDKNERLVSLDQAKTRFFANMTHEFRTPLVSLDTVLQTIQEKMVSNAELAPLLKSSHLALHSMIENINDLLSKTKTEQDLLQMRWARVDIVDLVRQTVDSFHP